MAYYPHNIKQDSKVDIEKNKIKYEQRLKERSNKTKSKSKGENK